MQHVELRVRQRVDDTHHRAQREPVAVSVNEHATPREGGLVGDNDRHTRDAVRLSVVREANGLRKSLQAPVGAERRVCRKRHGGAVRGDVQRVALVNSNRQWCGRIGDGDDDRLDCARGRCTTSCRREDQGGDSSRVGGQVSVGWGDREAQSGVNGH